jgi:aminopeptidase-like protein
MVVKILDKKFNIKQEEQTKNGSQIVEWRVRNYWSISVTFLVTSGKNPRINHESEKNNHFVNGQKYVIISMYM